MTTEPENYIPINAALSMKPSLGPIPSDQVFPWAVIVLGNLLVVKSLLGMNWVITILSIGWGIATWWILTGSDSGRFLSKFYAPPFWMYGCAEHTSLLEVHPDSAKTLARQQKDKKGKNRQRKSRWRRRRIQS